MKQSDSIWRRGRCGLPAVLLIALSACQQPGEMDKEKAGTLGGGAVGAAVGGLVGNSMGDSAASTVVGAVAGGALGAWLGNRFGAYLDERDRQEAERAAQAAISTGTSQAWRNTRSGVAGRAEVLGTSALRDRDGTLRTCRTVRQVIELPDGRQRAEDITACQGPDGWEIV